MINVFNVLNHETWRFLLVFNSDLTMKIMMNPMMFNVFLSLEMMDKMVI